VVSVAWLLDTDVLVDLRRSYEPALAWARSLDQLPRASGFAAMELAVGARDAKELREAEAYLRPLVMVWPSPHNLQYALARYAALHLSHGIGLMDALIAATAIGNDLSIATFNTRHFAAIPGIGVVQPYART
jgi:predicted nucleic acid-binding protein